ncbi:MAG: HNH endonuclease [Acidimicrobiia bacterium]|nr:HNH endonuclease [Acidimicrobiia bacterium]
MARTLVLNATEEPLAIVSGRRAVVLVLEEKADPVHLTEDYWRAERLAMVVPSVIRLRYYVRVPYRRRAALSRRGVFLRDGGVCQYCGRAAENIDHVVPRSRGGTHTWDNVVACCARCNGAKRDRLLSETRMRLRRPPDTPRHLSWVTVAVGCVPSAWAPYVAPAAGGSDARRDRRSPQHAAGPAERTPPEWDPLVAAAG